MTPDPVRRATEDDLDAIMAIFTGRRAWLHETKFSDQWASVHEWRHLLCFLIRRGHVRVLVDRGRVLGTVTIDTAPDRGFWTTAERQQPSLYVSKLATDVAHKGQELGAVLLDWVAGFAADKGIEVLRLDTWKTSSELQKYYATRGWQHIRTQQLDHRQSGALFERRVDLALDRPVETEPPTGQFAVSALLAAALSKAW